MIPRKIHKLYANLFGYFWIDCEHCGKGFGGHQWNFNEAMSDGWWIYAPGGVGFFHGGSRCAYCPQCAKTRDTWEPNWRQRKNNPEVKEIGTMA